MAQIPTLDNIGLSIDQVSQMTGVKKTTLRYWEKEFSDYLKPERTESMRRQYSLNELEKVATLRQLIEEEKYKSAGVRLKLGLSPVTPRLSDSSTPTRASPPQEASVGSLANQKREPEVPPDG
ncbi:MAG: MerR family transcriptional regulator [Deltaproteobacteria bacterium]|jgi:DNA-binding transcriptional MerR regulator|nr:MerR family transcriptional regulator [Deltaproteobacteria bacterium]